MSLHCRWTIIKFRKRELSTNLQEIWQLLSSSMCAHLFHFLAQTPLFCSAGLSSFSLPRCAQMFSSSSCSHRRMLSIGDHAVWDNVCDQIVCQIFIKFIIAVPYKHLSTKCESCNNQLLSTWKICRLFYRHTRVKLFSASWNRHKILHLFKINYKYYYYYYY